MTLAATLFLSYEDMAGAARTVTVPQHGGDGISAQVPYSSTHHDAVA